jgi:hypothetical protein
LLIKAVLIRSPQASLTIIPIDRVGDLLEPSIRKGYIVGARGRPRIAPLVLAVVVLGIVITDVPGELIVGRTIGWLRAVGSGLVGQALGGEEEGQDKEL